MTTYLFVSLIVFCAGFLQGLSGFGAVVFAVPLLSLLIGIKEAVPLGAMVGMTTSLLVLTQVRGHVSLAMAGPLLLGALPFIPVGAYFLKVVHRSTLEMILGAMLLGYAVHGFRFRKVRAAVNPWWGALFGVGVGFCSGAMSAGGPLAVTYASLTGWSKDAVKGTLQAYFLCSGAIVITSHALSGITTGQVLAYYLAALPALAAGVVGGAFFYRRIGDDFYRRGLVCLVGLLGVVMVARAL